MADLDKTNLTPQQLLAAAAADVLTSISEASWKRQQDWPGHEHRISRRDLQRLHDALERAHPGYLARIRELERQRKRARELELAEREQHAANLAATREGRR
jgi:hypothetical protein